MKKLIIISALIGATFSCRGFEVEGFRWDQSQITYSFGPGFPPAAAQTFRESFMAWQNQALRKAIVFVEVDRVSSGGDIQLDWKTDPTTVISSEIDYDTEGQIIIGARVLLAVEPSAPLQIPYDLKLLSLQLIGNLLGLGYNYEKSIPSVMYSGAMTALIQVDDIKGIAAIYDVPMSDLNLLTNAFTVIGQKWGNALKYKKPRELKGYRTGFIVIESGLNFYYFDAISQEFLGCASKGGKFEARR